MSSKIKSFFALHMLLMLYSVSSLLSKTAAGVEFLSLEFCLLYAGIIALLGLYAIGWQWILSRMPLTTAFSNKAVTVVWGIIWGIIFFAEPLTIPKAIGAVLIIAGVVLFSHSDIDEASDVQATQDQSSTCLANKPDTDSDLTHNCSASEDKRMLDKKELTHE